MQPAVLAIDDPRFPTIVSTLHRQTREEASSPQALKDEARRHLAVELLSRGQRSVKQVAWAVGFRGEKSFARAFRGWTGSPAASIRRQAWRATGGVGRSRTSTGHAPVP